MCVGVLLLWLGALPALAGPLGPAFAAQQQTAVLARVGDTGMLRCRVLRLGGRAVSWVRSSDLQILTHAGVVFTADARVACDEAPAGAPADAPRVTSRDGGQGAEGAVHTLRIARLRASDAGRYECQVNTEPKMSLLFNLTVIESSVPVVSVRALGAARGVAGGVAQLTCEARYSVVPGAPALPPELLGALPALRVRWTHDGDTLDPQSARGGVSLDTERWAGRVVSRLTLAQLRREDAGRYSCSAAPEGEADGEGARASLTLRLRGADDITGMWCVCVAGHGALGGARRVAPHAGAAAARGRGPLQLQRCARGRGRRRGGARQPHAAPARRRRHHRYVVCLCRWTRSAGRGASCRASRWRSCGARTRAATAAALRPRARPTARGRAPASRCACAATTTSQVCGVSVSLDTERWAGRVVSRLTLAQLRREDAGRYSCSAAPEGEADGEGARASLTLRLRGDDDITGMWCVCVAGHGALGGARRVAPHAGAAAARGRGPLQLQRCARGRGRRRGGARQPHAAPARRRRHHRGGDGGHAARPGRGARQCGARGARAAPRAPRAAAAALPHVTRRVTASV
ncbi:uncharacterized protein [Maniola hyperantus]|uniref:uncharacterized protein isoform X2 n=1 Tax=Aphantopus hyperantus TaxID=2795564 RepID=UPI0037484F79